MEYQRCARCIMDNESDASIRFQADGTCNYCNDTLKRRDHEYFPNEQGQKRLEAAVREMKAYGKGKRFDCMVGVSGGVDSSYLVYLGHQYGLRMLAVHIDDGLDTQTAKDNMEKLCEQAKVRLICIQPDRKQYADVTRCFFEAAVPNLAGPQDNLLLAALDKAAEEYGIYYNLSGANFALESILERSDGVNASDDKHIKAIHKLYGKEGIDKLYFHTLINRYIVNRYFKRRKTLCLLNWMDYNLERALKELDDFCGFAYYGGKHYESVLTRFLQCYYLPEKYKFDKRKSHYSSMILSGQMTREEALARMEKPAYQSRDLKEQDFCFLADYFGMSREDFDRMVALPPKRHEDYPMSRLNDWAWLARKLRRYLGA